MLHKYLLHFLWKKRFHLDKPPLNLNDIKRVLFIREDALGDLIVSLPFIRFLQRQYPQMKVSVLCSPRNAHLLDFDSSIEKIEVPFRKSGLRLFFRLFGQTRKHQFDLLVDPFDQRISRALLIYYAIKPRYYVGFAKKQKYGFNESHFQLMDHQMPLDPNLTYFESFRQLAEQLAHIHIDLASYRDLSTIPVSNEIRSRSKKFIDSMPKPFIYFHTDGADAIRTLPIEIVKTFADLLIKKGYTLLLSGRPETLQSLKQQYPQLAAHYLYPETTILDIYCLLEACDYVVTTDTSILQLASLLNCSLIGFYSQNPKRPIGDHYVIYEPFSDRFKVIYEQSFLNDWGPQKATKIIPKIEAFIPDTNKDAQQV